MGENKNVFGGMKEEEIKALANEMIAIRSSIDSDHMRKVFRKISLAEYSMLKRIFPNIGEECVRTPKYLQVLAKELDYSMQQTSRLVQALQSNGFLYWEHDKKGTFIRLTEHGLEVMLGQQEILMEYFSRVIQRITKERFVAIMEEMREIEALMDEEAAGL